MKRWLIALIVITVLAGGIIAVALANNKKEMAKVQPVQSVSVQEPEQKPVDDVPEPTLTTPDVSTQPVVAEPTSEPVEQPYTREEAYNKGIMAIMSWHRSAGAQLDTGRAALIIQRTYDQNPQEFTPSKIDSTLNKCVTYFDSLNTQEKIVNAWSSTCPL